ncbi:MAG: protoporphyrinogen oxidase [Pirellulales bacterium]
MKDTSTSLRKVAVIGGGITGLAAAHRLVELNPSLDVALFETRSRLGGVIQTDQADGFQAELSSDNFITTIPWGVDLCRRIGFEDQLIGTNPAHRQVFVVRGSRLHKLPDGFLMMAPSRIWPLAISPLLSPLGKLRMALEYFIPRRTGSEDESMAAFVRRRLGREAFDRLVEPLVSGIYAADLEKLSVAATLSRFRDMEREHGSLIRAVRRQMAAKRRADRTQKAGQGRAGHSHAHESKDTSGARYSMFVTPRDGLSSMVAAIAATLPAGAARLDSPVERIAPAAGGGWTVTLGHGAGAEQFDAVILSTPAGEAARLAGEFDPELAADLRTIPHSGTAVVSLGYRREQVGHKLDGMGFVVPAIEKRPLLACSFSSVKYPGRAPDGSVLLRMFLGGACRQDLLELADEPLKELVFRELAELLGVRGEPSYCRIARWPGTMPQYHVGHQDLVARIERRESAWPDFALSGNAYHGVGLPDCIHSGEQAAERILDRQLAGRPSSAVLPGP